MHWDQVNTRHIAEHDIRPEEVEQVIANSPLDIPPPHVQNGELRFTQPGETNAGRVLFVITTEIETSVRVVTAFDAKPKWRRYYKDRRSREHGSQV